MKQVKLNNDTLFKKHRTNFEDIYEYLCDDETGELIVNLFYALILSIALFFILFIRII